MFRSGSTTVLSARRIWVRPLSSVRSVPSSWTAGFEVRNAISHSSCRSRCGSQPISVMAKPSKTSRPPSIRYAPPMWLHPADTPRSVAWNVRRIRVPGARASGAPPSTTAVDRNSRSVSEKEAAEQPAVRVMTTSASAAARRVSVVVGTGARRRVATTGSRRRVPDHGFPSGMRHRGRHDSLRAMESERSPLVSVERLAEWLASPNPPVVVDVRWYLAKPGAGHAAYLEGHLPNAIFLDLDADLADPTGLGAPGRHPLPSPEAFLARMGAAGIGDGDRVVGYDDVGGWVAARLWWMLDNLGFGRRGVDGEWVGVLDGGIKAWAEAGEPLARDVPQPPPTSRLT